MFGLSSRNRQAEHPRPRGMRRRTTAWQTLRILALEWVLFATFIERTMELLLLVVFCGTRGYRTSALSMRWRLVDFILGPAGCKSGSFPTFIGTNVPYLNSLSYRHRFGTGEHRHTATTPPPVKH